MDKNHAGTKFHNWTKQLDFTHRQIDTRSERNENEEAFRNHKEVNENGRVWSF
jgi:hypothetical protein